MLESAHFEVAVKLVFRGELVKHAITEGTKALAAYELSMKATGEQKKEA
jgi:hypothetical protein